MEDPPRPTDDEIIAQQNAIRASVAALQEYIAMKDPILVLASEYENGNIVIRKKIEGLSREYKSIRRTRGDGNCFFRAFMFSYLENLLTSSDRTEWLRMRKQMEQCKQHLQQVGYAELTWDDFMSVFLEQLEAVDPLNPNRISMDELIVRGRSSEVSDYVVMLLRFITSCEITRRADFFYPFVLGTTGLSTEEFCRASVEPMGEESDHIHITALTDALGVSIRVVYLDGHNAMGGGGGDSGSDQDASVNFHDFQPEGTQASLVGGGVAAAVVPAIVLLYRPGHYDILYSS